MNTVLAGIYGTGGMEKTASPGGQGQMTLQDLSLMIISSAAEEDEPIEKLAAEAQSLSTQLINFDAAGRSIAHAEFALMEKAAAEGDPSALQAFFAEAGE